MPRAKPAPAIKNPVLQQLYGYWDGKRGQRAMPRRDEIVPEDIGDLLPHAFLIDVSDADPRFRFSLCGPDVAGLFGMDLTGRALEDIDLADEYREIVHDYALAADHRRPICTRHHFVNRAGRTLDYERVLLPLQDAGGDVRWLMGGLIGSAKLSAAAAE